MSRRAERAAAAHLMGVKYRNVPPWARDLIEAVCQDEGVEVPYVEWAEVARPGSSGYAHDDRMLGLVIKAGWKPLDMRHVLLHELAHWIVGAEHDHDATFFNKAFALYRRWSDPMNFPYHQRREAVYKKRSVAIGVAHSLKAEGWL